jgi:hypothetical protein
VSLKYRLATLLALALLVAPAFAQFGRMLHIDNTPLDPRTWNPATWHDQNSTVFVGQSGRRYQIEYSIKNETDEVVHIHFYPTNHRAMIRPGGTITCRSPATEYGSEHAGVRHDYPKIAATPERGHGWYRTISRDRGEYFVVRTQDGGVRVVP